MRRLQEEASAIVRAVFTWRMAPAFAAVVIVVLCAVVGIVLREPNWITPLAAIAIACSGMMFGVRGGFTAALIASVGFMAWAIGHDGFDTTDLIDHRYLLYIALGLLTGYFAYGALGDYHLGRAVVRGRLREAIRRGRIVLYYQPVAEARTGKIICLEALVRWHHPSRGTLLPAEFLPAAEGDKATIGELTIHTLQLAIDQCETWQQEGHDVGVAVNLSPAAVDHSGLVEEISRMLSGAGVSPPRLTLEVTESAVMQSAAMEQVLAKMRSGESTAIAIDDFGTGYSSLARLEELPVDSLKIDRSFIRRSEDDRGVSMLKSIIDLAHRLDMTACAEGVEDRATWDLLITLGCDWVQGYELGYPMPAEQVGPWLERNWGENGPPAAVPTSTNTT